ncbi:RNA polymerase sigma factor [Anaerorhabdus sp.]|uniref:RNA polymerase sigma factor n=1 Tax=Anaerorhabdus sp. TaxID=1872524 RepID=UPI002B1F48FC|nr:RNA polymerase sigma factor [Anaerorhabdus sp.]MEA4874511.1 RNA polymerase sigma factor [Anaerorhabdus sp.]
MKIETKKIYSNLADLVKKVKKGDSEAFSELYSATYQKMYFFALSLSKNEQLALDIVQDAYILVIQNLVSLKDESMFIAWFNRIVYTTSMKYLKNENKCIMLDPTVVDTIATNEDGMDPLAKVVKDEEAKLMLTCIGKLTPKLKAVIILKYYEMMKEKEIAKALEIPIGTVKSRLKEAKNKLKKMIEEEEVDLDEKF